jgi:tRNA(Ile)-lysidine synthase TilS/MesJ
LLEARKNSDTTLVATGHTLDDQAETILMRLVRGAGATALTGMAPAGPGPFVRPILGQEREELRRYLSRHNLSFREDPTNSDLRFDRNRVRQLALPLLAETLNPRAARHLVKAAGRFREDAIYLDQLAEELLARLTTHRRGGLSLDLRRLVETPPALANRGARLALEWAGVDPRRIVSRHVEALLALAGGSGTRLDFPGGVTAHRGRLGQVALLNPSKSR